MAITAPGSVNDDLERFIEKLRLGRRQQEEVRPFQFPKLTEEELQLWENRDPEFLSRLQVQPDEERQDPLEFMKISCSRLTMFKDPEGPSRRCNLS